MDVIIITIKNYYFIFYDGNINLIKKKTTFVVENCISTKNY